MGQEGPPGSGHGLAASLILPYLQLCTPPPDAPLAGLPLPRSISMSYEIDKMFPYNAGIILANLPVMRENYKVGVGEREKGGQGVGMWGCGVVGGYAGYSGDGQGGACDGL